MFGRSGFGGGSGGSFSGGMSSGFGGMGGGFGNTGYRSSFSGLNTGGRTNLHGHHHQTLLGTNLDRAFASMEISAAAAIDTTLNASRMSLGMPITVSTPSLTYIVEKKNRERDAEEARYRESDRLERHPEERANSLMRFQHQLNDAMNGESLSVILAALRNESQMFLSIKRYYEPPTIFDFPFTENIDTQFMENVERGVKLASFQLQAYLEYVFSDTPMSEHDQIKLSSAYNRAKAICERAVSSMQAEDETNLVIRDWLTGFNLVYGVTGAIDRPAGKALLIRSVENGNPHALLTLANTLLWENTENYFLWEILSNLAYEMLGIADQAPLIPRYSPFQSLKNKVNFTFLVSKNNTSPEISHVAEQFQNMVEVIRFLKSFDMKDARIKTLFSSYINSLISMWGNYLNKTVFECNTRALDNSASISIIANEKSRLLSETFASRLETLILEKLRLHAALLDGVQAVFDQHDKNYQNLIDDALMHVRQGAQGYLIFLMRLKCLAEGKRLNAQEIYHVAIEFSSDRLNKAFKMNGALKQEQLEDLKILVAHGSELAKKTLHKAYVIEGQKLYEQITQSYQDSAKGKIFKGLAHSEWKKNPPDSFRRLRNLAKSNPVMRYWLGQVHEYLKSEKEARECYASARMEGCPEAIYREGQFYQDGTMVKGQPNVEKAFACYYSAARGGVKNAKHALKEGVYSGDTLIRVLSNLYVGMRIFLDKSPQRQGITHEAESFYDNLYWAEAFKTDSQLYCQQVEKLLDVYSEDMPFHLKMALLNTAIAQEKHEPTRNILFRRGYQLISNELSGGLENACRSFRNFMPLVSGSYLVSVAENLMNETQFSIQHRAAFVIVAKIRLMQTNQCTGTSLGICNELFARISPANLEKASEMLRGQGLVLMEDSARINQAPNEFESLLQKSTCAKSRLEACGVSLEEVEREHPEFFDRTVTMTMMDDPVMASNGICYDLITFIGFKGKNPIDSSKPLAPEPIVCVELRGAIIEYVELKEKEFRERRDREVRAQELYAGSQAVQVSAVTASFFAGASAPQMLLAPPLAYSPESDYSPHAPIASAPPMEEYIPAPGLTPTPY